MKKAPSPYPSLKNFCKGKLFTAPTKVRNPRSPSHPQRKEKSGMFSSIQRFYYKYAWFFRGLFKVFSTVFHILWKTLWIIYKFLIFFYRNILKFFNWLD